MGKDSALLDELGLQPECFEPCSEPGKPEPGRPSLGKTTWAANYQTSYRVVPNEERIGRVHWPASDRLLVMLLGLGRCLGCRHSIIDTPFHMEHTIRHACGGSNRFDNIRPVCRCCHGRKDFLDGTQRLGEVGDLARSTRLLGRASGHDWPVLIDF